MSCYLFDFDGTLVDSMPSYVKVMLRILDENGIAYTNDIIKIITPLGYKGTAKYFREIGLQLPEDKIIASMTKYAIDAYTYRIQAKNNVEKVVKELKARGASLHVLTASPHITLDPCLKRIGIYDLFENVWSCDDFNTTKTDPRIYHEAAKRIGQPIADILFLDDNYNADFICATTGMMVCGVYDDSSAAYEAQIREVSDYYIRDFSELLEIDKVLLACSRI